MGAYLPERAAYPDRKSKMKTAIIYLGQDFAYSDLPTTPGFDALFGDGDS